MEDAEPAQVESIPVQPGPSAEPAPAQADAELEAPKRGRGRPAGSKNRPKVTIVPLEADEPPAPPTPPDNEPTAPELPAKPAPRPRKPKPVPVAPIEPVVWRSQGSWLPQKQPPIDHHSVMRYLATQLQEQQKNEREAKIDHFTRLINRNRWM